MEIKYLTNGLRQINVREYQRGNQEWKSRETGNMGYVYKMKKNKTKTQHNMCQTPLYTNKHKKRKLGMSPLTNIWR